MAKDVRDQQSTESSTTNTSADQFFKIGGTTLGSAVVGSAVGNVIAPAGGAIVGAVVGTIAGATLLRADNARRKE